MKLPLSWLKEYVDIKIPIEELAARLTFGGLEVEQAEFYGIERPAAMRSMKGDKPELAWDREKFFVAEILKVEQHPNADRLTLATVDYGAKEPIQVVTGAPNIKVGEKGYKVAFVLEGARLFDGHKEGWELMTLKRSKIRGIESGCMVCSEKELGLSEDHEGIIIFPDDAPVGKPLADYLGDVVFDIKINPNMARCASVIGMAREVAALTGQTMRPIPQKVISKGAPIQGQVSIVIKNAELNPRFTLALLKDATIKSSPYWMQRRLLLAGMRPISNIVDVTNYVMLETGQPLHAFDYDKLVGRARGIAPTIITRLAEPGEELETLDGVKRKLDPFTILVCDTKGSLSIGGVMGGAESEVDANSKNILLEAASWEFINIRKTIASQKLSSEAGVRFSRGVHPAQAKVGLLRAIELMRELGGGGSASHGGTELKKNSTVPRDNEPKIAKGIIDEYPLKPKKIVIDLPVSEVKRQLGVEIPVKDVVRFLEALEFQVTSEKLKAKSKKSSTATRHSPLLRVTVPDHRLDVDGTDDLIEEIARLYGYAKIPISRMNDELPPQKANADLEQEERVRDILIDAGLQDVISYTLTTPEREAALTLDPERPAFQAREYVRIENPVSADLSVLRQTLLPSMLRLASSNLRYRARVAMFEIGIVFLARHATDVLLPREVATEQPEDRERNLPLERRRLGIVLTGPREEKSWQASDTTPMDFYDFKGVVQALLDDLHVTGALFTAIDHPLYHPGRTAALKIGDETIGVFGEVHPLMRERFDLPAQAVMLGEFDLDALLARAPSSYKTASVSRYPGVAQDLALIVDENVQADQVHALIQQTGGAMVQRVTLFDVYRGDQIPPGKKSLAYSLTFQAMDKTLSDADASKVREKIVARLKRELNADVRGA